MRKFFTARRILAVALSLALLLGCFGMAAQAADTDPFRVVVTYAGEDGKTIGFHWFTKAQCEAIVKIDGSPYGGGPQTFISGNNKFQGNYDHRVIIEGLTPGPHTYDIGGVTGTFHVNPGRGNDFEFIVTGDVQASDKAGFDYSAKTHEEAWAAFPNAAFSAVLGDLTNDSNNAQWDMFFEAFAPFNAKGAMVPVAGNHDGTFKWNWFRNMFTLKEPNNAWSNMTGVYYSFDYGDAHIAVLNTNDMYPMTVAQQNWLVNDMKASDAKWKIVLTHRPPYTMGSHANSPELLPMRRTLIPLFDRAGVDLVMSGHDHIYARTRPMRGDKPAGEPGNAYTDPAGTLYLLPGAAGAKRYDIVNTVLPSMKAAMVKCEQPGMPIFTGISVAGDTLTYTAYTYDPATQASAEYDSLTITKTVFAGADPSHKPLPTDFLNTLPQNLWGFVMMIFGLLGDYLFRLLPALIGIG